jgi:hypothetical protein
MTTPTPDFDELVGPGLEPAERERLHRVHDLLIEAGPPPEASALTAPPVPGVVLPLRRRRGALVAIAAAFGVLVFAVGFLLGNDDRGYVTFKTVAMTGTSEAEGARATIEIFDVDPAGNWPMEIAIDGLLPAPSGDAYELWLTRGGRPVALCGSFRADADASTVVPMNAPWRLDDSVGWIVVREGSDVPLLTT